MGTTEHVWPFWIRVSNDCKMLGESSLIPDADKQLDTVRAELKQVETSVAAQNISPEEATRMNNERDTLKSTLEELRNKVTDGSSAAYDQELNVTRSIDRFEQLLVDYTALAHQIGVINPGTEGPGPRLGPDGVDYNIDIDFGLEDMNEIQASGKRLRSVIWPSLQAFGERFRKQELESGNQMIELEDSHDRIGQDVEKQRFAMEHLELKVKSTTEQAEGAKTVSLVRLSRGRTGAYGSFSTSKLRRPRPTKLSPSWKARSLR